MLEASTGSHLAPVRQAGRVELSADSDRGPVRVELGTLAGPAGSAPIIDPAAPITVRRSSRQERRNASRANRQANRREYEAAGTGRNNAGWNATGTGANTEIRKALPLLRARSRELVRDNAFAERILGVTVANLVGEGIRPRSTTGIATLDRKVNDLWAAWAKVADPFHGLDVYGVQALAVRSWLEGGDCLVRYRARRLDDGLPVPFQLEIMEGDLLDSWRLAELVTGGRIVSGVEFDPLGRRSAYWILPYHPGDSAILGLVRGGNSTSSPVPASSVIHLYRPVRAGQVRGVPMLAPVAQDIRDLDDYAYAERVRKRIEACVAAFVLGNTPADADPADDGIAPSVEDADGNPIEEFTPGMVALVRDGKDVRFNTPNASPDYSGYKDAEVREIAAGTHTTFEQVSGNLSGVNFASYRVGRIEFFRHMRQLYKLILIPKLCDPMWQWFTDTAQAAGLIPLRASGYPCKWSEPRFESIERDKDANADKLEVRNGTRSLFDVIAASGRDPEATLQEIADSWALVDKLGLVLDVDPRRTGAPGAGPAGDGQATGGAPGNGGNPATEGTPDPNVAETKSAPTEAGT